MNQDYVLYYSRYSYPSYFRIGDIIVFGMTKRKIFREFMTAVLTDESFLSDICHLHHASSTMSLNSYARNGFTFNPSLLLHLSSDSAAVSTLLPRTRLPIQKRNFIVIRQIIFICCRLLIKDLFEDVLWRESNSLRIWSRCKIKILNSNKSIRANFSNLKQFL